MTAKSNDLLVLEPGAELAVQKYGPTSRTTLALFAGASGDHNPIHIDMDFARKAGVPDVFAHGMLSMAYLGRYLRSLAPASHLKAWNVRFTAITPVNTEVICFANILEKREEEGGTLIRLKLGARLPDGTQTLAGDAEFVF